MRPSFQKDYKFVLGQSLPETVLANNTAYPASGSYVAVVGHEWVEVVIHLGTIADAVVFTLKQTDGVSGATLDTIDTANCKKTIATTDDGQIISMHLQTEQLAADHNWITCYASGISGSNYADIIYLLGGTRDKPVTQATAVCPSDNQLMKAG